MRDGGESGGERELAAQNLVGVGSGWGQGDGEGVALDDDAEGAVLAKGDAIGADANIRRIVAADFGRVDIQKLGDFFTALIDGEVGGRGVASGKAGGGAAPSGPGERLRNPG